MGIVDKIKELEAEYARTQKNKATEGHLGIIKAKLSKLRSSLLEEQSSSGGGGDGFDVKKSGDGRVALIGFPSVGKSSLLSTLTSTQSEAAGYEFTTLTCIPGNILYNDTKIQLLDLPGIIEGAAHGKGRGKEVIAVARTSDLVLIVLDAGKEGVDDHKGILERELETVGLRLNKTPPNIALVKKATGGVKFNATVPLTKLGDDPAKTVNSILHEFRLHNCEVLFRGDYGTDELIDVINGNCHTCTRLQAQTHTQTHTCTLQPRTLACTLAGPRSWRAQRYDFFNDPCVCVCVGSIVLVRGCAGARVGACVGACVLVSRSSNRKSTSRCRRAASQRCTHT